jgi:hypothetical protein
MKIKLNNNFESNKDMNSNNLENFYSTNITPVKSHNGKPYEII